MILFFLFIKQASSEECLVNCNVINFGTSLCEEYNYKCARNCQNTKGAFLKELKSTTIQLIPLFLFVVLIVWIVRKINIKRQNQREEEEKED